MRLPEFIEENTESILEEFEEFARTHTAAGDTMDIAALRDHAAAMLSTIAFDITEEQSEEAQKIKAKGDAPPSDDEAPTAAEKHGADRAGRGFSLDEMFSEYRALRGSVLRLWTDSADRQLDEQDVDDLIRFNEAIDQSLAESITQFSTGLDTSREMFIAILGHDLRSPLGAMLTASSFLETDGGLKGPNLTMAKRIRSSGERMKKLIADLLDFTTARLGRGIPVDRAEADVAEITRETLAEIGGQHPDRELRFEAAGDTGGEWDAQRISQALSNLIGNAVQHGATGTPITVDVTADDEEVVVSVHNKGSVIRADDMRQIFDPFKRMATGKEEGSVDGSLGLGLYIAQQIAFAHGGWIDVRSSAATGTTFLLHLPREG